MGLDSSDDSSSGFNIGNIYSTGKKASNAFSGIIGGGTRLAAEGYQKGLDRDIPQLDQATQGLSDQQGQRANRDEGEFYNDQMGGVDQSGQLKAAQEQAGQGAGSLGGNQSFLGSALGERSKRNYDQSMSQMSRQAQLQAPINKFQERQIAGELANEQYKIAAGAYNRQNEAYQNMVKARGEILGSVLGGIGSMFGSMSGGGFGGGGNNQSAPTTQYNGNQNYSQNNDSYSSGGIGSARGNYGSA